MRVCYCGNLHKNLNRYCSIECNKKIRERRCLKCNNIFYLKNLAYEKRGQGKYCSLTCSKFATKKFDLNEDYFKSIDNSNKAYWLGFCMADCYNSNDELIFELAVKDKDHLSKFKNDLKSNQELKIIKNNKYCKIRFSSRKLCSDLSKLGCIPKKSLVLKFPEINTKFYSHFIRGVFDGDGCIYIGKKSKSWSIYSGSKEFIDKIYDILKENNINIKIRKQKTGYVICVYKREEILKIYSYMYQDTKIYLERKKVIFESLI